MRSVFGRRADEKARADERTRADERARADERTRADERAVDQRATVDRDRDGIDDRAQSPAAVPADAALRVHGRTSFAAVLALILGLTGLYAALTGRLAPVGMALSILGVLVAFGGVRADRPAVADRAAIDQVTGGRTGTGRPAVRTMGRRAVAGGGLASFALLVSVAGIIVAFLALNHTSSWLDSDIDQVSRARDWLDTWFPWMTDW